VKNVKRFAVFFVTIFKTVFLRLRANTSGILLVFNLRPIAISAFVMNCTEQNNPATGIDCQKNLGKFIGIKTSAAYSVIRLRPFAVIQ